MLRFTRNFLLNCRDRKATVVCMAATSQELLRSWCEERDPDARRRLIELHLPLVQALARRFASRGEQFEDLAQVGAVGLIKAIDRYDPRRGSSLTAYAVPTIVGEIRRHLRDSTHPLRVPRRTGDEPSRSTRTPRRHATPAPSAGSSSARSAC